MRKLESRLEVWSREGLITAEQQTRILDFERAAGGARWSQITLYAFLILGGCVISIGVISLVAANWEEIPEAVKLLAAFASLVGLAVGAYRAHDRGRHMIFEVLATVEILWSLATIGLISQVFHTGGEVEQALLFWLAIALPLVLSSRRGFLPAVWAVGLLTTFLLWALDDESWYARTFLTSSGGWIDDENIFPLFATCALWTTVVATACSLAPRLDRLSSNFALWSWLALLAAVLAGDIYYAENDMLDARALWPALILLPVAVASVLLGRGRGRLERVLLSALLVLSALIFLPSLTSPSRSFGDEWSIVGAAYSIVTLGLVALYCATSRRQRLFHAATAAVGVRFLVGYFQLFEDLATTGVGLVLSGLVIIGLAVGWFKNRDRLEGWARRLAS